MEGGSEPLDERVAEEKISCPGRARRWITSANGALFIAFSMSKWGDWMWFFASGLFFVYLDDGLQLTAIFGFSSGGAMLLFGGLIGSWVDRTSRISAVRVSLVIQNLSVAVCAVCICVTLRYEEELRGYLQDYYTVTRDVVIISLAVLGNLASMAYSIAITRDWIVVLARGDKSMLANLNAATRSIHLTCQILAPTFVGLIMTSASMFVAAVTIASWNMGSVAVEYILLTRVYSLIPELAKDKSSEEPDKSENTNGAAALAAAEKVDPEAGDGGPEEEAAEVKEGLLSTDKAADNRVTAPGDGEDTETAGVGTETGGAGTGSSKDGKCCGFLARIVTSWVIYFRQPVVFAGLSLALLYITVMGFDSVTTGFIYKNGISEVVVGICSAIGGLAGILGTFLFTRSRKRVGLERTGLFAFQFEVACLVLAVISVFAPGSPFDPYGTIEGDSHANCTSNTTGPAAGSLSVLNITQTSAYTVGNSTLPPDCEVDKPFNISVILFLIGIITSRVGLWMADLVVTQILQESVLETERGVVGGAQDSLNMMMDMIKFAVIISFPGINFFGVHIIWSFCSIFLAACLFAYHSWRVRGHLFHFEKVRKFMCNGRSEREEAEMPPGSHFSSSLVVHA